MVEQEENVAEDAQQDVVQPDPVENTPSVESDAPQESDKERNFRELRESKKHLERDLRELRKRVEEMSKPAPPPEEPELSDDDLVEGRHLRKHLRKLEEQIAQQKMEAIPDKLRSKFEDFDQVVTKDNIEKLKQQEPELFASITAAQDLYSKGVSAYKALKKFGIVKEDKYASDKERVSSQASRPMSTQAIKGQGALHEANAFAQGLTPELRKQLLEEMRTAARGF